MKVSNKIIALSIIFSSWGLGNRGMMPFNPQVQIFEPNQRAMIAWNGSEQILLLSTDLHASDSTMVLEVLPVPGEPEVKKGDLETFRKATELINRKLQAQQPTKGYRTSEGVVVPSGEVTFHAKIGAHDISVTRLFDAPGFVDWVLNYLRTRGVDEDIVTPRMRGLIDEYIAEGFEWFVFDVVSLGEATVTSEPLQYRFKTRKLFYPLKITSTGAGSTSIELLILTPRLLSRFPGVPIESIELKHEPVTITREELKELNSEMHELMDDCPEVRLRIWQLEGSLKSFDRDLIAH
ncbi:DUF2330 domain-containing protein [candidate division WOR-3 bacterium]|nr:DUF2330 domain-containing protein [candidate division WOR-3 bacterium]